MCDDRFRVIRFSDLFPYPNMCSPPRCDRETCVNYVYFIFRRPSTTLTRLVHGFFALLLVCVLNKTVGFFFSIFSSFCTFYRLVIFFFLKFIFRHPHRFLTARVVRPYAFARKRTTGPIMRRCPC